MATRQYDRTGSGRVGFRRIPTDGVAEEIAALRGTRPARLKDLLVAPDFSRLWRAMLVSSLGDWVGFVAVAALVARLAGERLGGLAVAGVMLTRLLPSVVFGPFAGVLVDRLDRRKLMIGADIARGALYASMPLLPSLPAIFLVSFAIECMSLLWTPAKDASIPNLVPKRQLPNANSIGLITTYGTLPLGAAVYTALAGVAVGIGTRVDYFRDSPEFLALWLDALTFLFSAYMVAGLSLRPTPRAASRDGEASWTATKREISEGFRFLRRQPLIRAMTLGIVVAFAGAGSVISLGPVFARYSLNAGSTGFGVLMVALGIGMGIGLGSMTVLARGVEKDRLFSFALWVAAASLFGIAAMPALGPAALLTVPGGAGVGLAWVTGYTILQENVSDELRGRTFATLTVSARLAMFLALAVFPALATAFGDLELVVADRVVDMSGTRLALWLGALVIVLASGLARRGLRRSRLARPRPLTLEPKLVRDDRPGLFVVFEGVEGSGKGTQIELARGFLESRGREVVVTREPGGTGFGDRLRETILDKATGKVDPRAEALLFAAARAQNVAEVIRPALAEGKVVLCDRFIDSSVAYQGTARGLGEQDVLNLNVWATQGLFPDLVILLHLEPELGLLRATGDPDRIESEDVSFHAKVSDAYLRIADDHPDRFRVIDASLTTEEVRDQVREALSALLEPSDRAQRGGAT